jgi:hypothetical protein
MNQVTKDEALKLALDWYDSGHEDREEFQAMIENLLASPVQEPSYRCQPYSSVPGAKVSAPVDYYTTPPAAPVQVIPLLNNPDKELRWGADGFWSLHYAGTLIRFLDKHERNFVDSAIAAAARLTSAQPAPVPLTDEQKRELIKDSALWDMHIHVGWYSAPAKSFVEKTIQLIADIEAAHGITEKGQP